MRRWAPITARDLLLAAGCLGLWALEARSLAGAAGLAVSVAAGALTAVVGFLAHEWGHLLGAVLAGARVEANGPGSFFLFRFDVSRNDRRQFLAMSRGGYVASALGIATIAALVPWDRPSGWVALGLAGAGVVATLALEVPVHLAVRRGGPLPREGIVYVSDPPRAAPGAPGR